MEGQCAGEKVVLVVPPEFGYGDNSADKVKNLHKSILFALSFFLPLFMYI